MRKEEVHLNDDEALLPVAHFHKVGHNHRIMCVYIHISIQNLSFHMFYASIYTAGSAQCVWSAISAQS